MSQAYSGPAGATLSGGYHRLPAWLRARTVGLLEEIPGTALAGSPALFDWGASPPGMQSSIVDAWGGWVLTPAGQIIVEGGGHSNGGDNSRLGLWLHNDVLSWYRVSDPTPLDKLVRFVNGGSPNYSRWNEDGKPQAAHVYWSAQMVGNRILRPPYFADFGKTLSGTLAFAPNNEPWMIGLDPATGLFDAPNTHPYLPNWSAASPNNGGGMGSGPCGSDGSYYYAVCINAALGAYYMHRLALGGTFETVGAALATPTVASGTYPCSINDLKRNCLVQIGEKTDKWVRRFSFTTGAKTDINRTGVDFGGTWDSSYSGGTHDTKRDKYYVYSGQAATDKNIYVIDPDSAETSIMPGTGTPSVTTNVNGINSRMKYIEQYDCVLIQPNFASNLLCLRLS